MCLFIEGGPKIEFLMKEKKFYKILFRSHRDTSFVTAYKFWPVKLFKKYRIWNPFFIKHEYDGMVYYEGGGFHLYETYQDAFEDAKIYESSMQKVAVVETIVPKFTRIIRGTFCDQKSLITKRVRYTNIVWKNY